MKVIIAGSRELTDYNELVDAITNSGFQIDEVVSGGARGADALGEQFAEAQGIPLKKFPADWTKGKSAGIMRNIAMAEYADAAIVVRYPESRGSIHMASHAEKKGLKVHEVVLEDETSASVEPPYKSTLKKQFDLYDYQQECCDTVLASDKHLVCLDAPVGSGKSIIAIEGLAKVLEAQGQEVGIITPEVVLQDQYLSDFSSDLADLRGRSHYECEVKNVPCNEYACRNDDKHQEGCGYKEAKAQWIDNPIKLSGFEMLFFLAEPNGIHLDVLIIDEAHLLINKALLMGNSEMYLTPAQSKTVASYKSSPPDVYRYLMQQLKTTGQYLVFKQHEKKDPTCRCRDCSYAKPLYFNLQRAQSNPEDYAVTEMKQHWQDKSTWVLELSCLDYRWMFNYLYGIADKVVLMTGTWGNRALKDFLNITDEDHIVVESQFSEENVSIVYPEDQPYLSRDRDGAKRRDAMARSINALELPEYKDHRGIIFCSSKKDLDYYKAQNNSRLVFDEGSNRTSALRQVKHSTNKVFVTYNCRTGLNLPYLHFGILLKFPVPPYTKMWAALNKRYTGLYDCMGLINSEQAFGRLIRGKDDAAEFIVMDKVFNNKRALAYMSANFRKAEQIDDSRI